jgi:Lrp/AsnC family leucine-responsive transcriptional regulator
MERSGVITGYHAQVDPKSVGKTLLVFVEITLTTKSGDVFEQVRKALLHMPEVMACYLVSGNFDYLVKARLNAMPDYRELLSSILQKIPVPSQSHSYVVMEEVKDTAIMNITF